MVRWYLYLYSNAMSWRGKMTSLQWAMMIRSAEGRKREGEGEGENGSQDGQSV